MVKVNIVRGRDGLRRLRRQHFGKPDRIGNRFTVRVADLKALRAIACECECAQQVPLVAVARMICSELTRLTIVHECVGDVVTIIVLAGPPRVDLVVASPKSRRPGVGTSRASGSAQMVRSEIFVTRQRAPCSCERGATVSIIDNDFFSVLSLLPYTGFQRRYSPATH